MHDYDRTAADKQKVKTVTIEFEDKYGDTEDAILRVLQFFQYCGNVGTSQSIEVNKMNLSGFDGDGSDRIKVIKVDGKEVHPSEKSKELFKKVTYS